MLEQKRRNHAETIGTPDGSPVVLRYQLTGRTSSSGTDWRLFTPGECVEECDVSSSCRGRRGEGRVEVEVFREWKFSHCPSGRPRPARRSPGAGFACPDRVLQTRRASARGHRPAARTSPCGFSRAVSRSRTSGAAAVAVRDRPAGRRHQRGCLDAFASGEGRVLCAVVEVGTNTNGDGTLVSHRRLSPYGCGWSPSARMFLPR